MKHIIVDVDNTLADFSPVFYQELKKRCPAIPKCSEWTSWDFYTSYISKELFYDSAHAAQMRIMETEPLTGAKRMLDTVANYGHVVIASHRKQESFDLLVDWLVLHDMAWDDIHISHDKRTIFNTDTVLIIDDCPATMQAGMDFGFRAASRVFPWNECMRGTGAFLGESLYDVMVYARECLA